MTRPEFRNVAIVAHVDHGKTTLVDAMLRQSGAFDEHAELVDRVMDSGDLEKEKGITILAKNTAIRRKGAGKDGNDLVINVIDTPGHADFGGEVERALSMVDGVVLLVDASEGPLPQTRFVLGKALAAKMPVIILVNKTDRPDARIDEVVEESQDLLLELASALDDPEAAEAAEQLLDLPVLYASGREGKASVENPGNGNIPDAEDLQALFDVIYDVMPEPTVNSEGALQAHVTNLDSSSFLGRIGLIRVHSGTLKKGQQVAWIHYDEDGNQHIKSAKIAELLRTVGVTRVPADEVVAGDIAAISGIDSVMIGDTLADPENPVALPRITVDEPAISMTIGVNTSPLAGRGGGDKLTARVVKARLDQELIGNVSIRVLPTERPDAWEVQGRGEMSLSVLVETMRREGFELTVGKPQVVTQTIDGKLYEPYEHMVIDIPSEYQGNVTQLMAARKGQMLSMDNISDDWVRMEYKVPARGLISFRTIFLTETRGTGIANSYSEGIDEWAGEIKGRASGSLVADRSGQITAYALTQLSDRGNFFVEPGMEAYEGMVVGANNRDEDMDVNITKEKKLTNMRSATADATVTLAKAHVLSLDEAMEFCGQDECVEVTPNALRVRKVILNATERGRARAREKARNK
ncbi:translational GTPase TypA [Corynebacterium pseudotuberculosis]|uniref:Large ribosomal subunit assembly factor BipA n=1 Tax=Corynebacterium pseudotuberculosis (strain C231) TaxID=681645 RepID=D9Q9M3_CORP2|nr:translational GTPase TypA [Corynebacterium pseudotuberculosis]ADK28561.1 translational GTPase TypA [Corynebacterium pseudotuberculosis FRC41]ADL10249.1 translational GTPase TypA [Corynebacterium pseudotuberculosis C231]ADL20657.1 translational GTPase TypA [Corynebacterium pseudotuberculosis 1002]ADO26041.1 translational GTPase TypA [Corynebacterium pseudotuberculosis I19]AEK92098.1 GTP-binding protein TypA/BipA [Corynebacterium pseudotuberculosis PAT10]